MHFLLCLLLPVCRVSCVRPQLFVENSFRPGIILICSVPVVLWQIDFQDVSAGCPQVESIHLDQVESIQWLLSDFAPTGSA